MPILKKYAIACLIPLPLLCSASEVAEQAYSAPSIWTDHKEWIVMGLAALLLQAVAIAVLLLSRHRRLIKDLESAKEDLVSQRKSAEENLRSKVLIQKVIDSSPDWIFVKDQSYRFLIVNEPFSRVFGKAPEELIGQLDTDFIPLELCVRNPQTGVAGLHDHDLAVFQGETVHLFPEHIFLPGDRPRVFDTFKTPLRDAQQRIFGNLCYRRDVTEKFHREQEQRTLERQLQQAQKMELIGHLTGGVAHDFNNILASILGYTELIQMKSGKDLKPDTAKYLGEILQAGIRGKELVQQLLTFSQKREAVAMTLFVPPIVKEVVKLLQSILPRAISITSRLEKDLPQVLMSPVQLHQILMNLGVNARDAISGSGQIEFSVASVTLGKGMVCESCHSAYSGNYLVLSVRDSGCGIPVEHRAKIFDPFFTTKRVGSGSGLGLSVLHGIVHSADGHLELHSESGKGSEFRVYLPAQAQSQPERRKQQRPLPVMDNGLSAHVLVVDDEPAIVAMLQALLEDAGCRVSGFTSPVAALELFRNNPQAVDLLITDFTMPELTGLDLARAVLSDRPEMPVILCTGYSALIDESTAHSMGIRRFLLKPVPSATLLDAVVQSLDPAADRQAGRASDSKKELDQLDR